MHDRSRFLALLAAGALLFPGGARAAFDAATYFHARQQLAQDHTLAVGGGGIYAQLVRLERNAGPLDLAAIQETLDKLAARRDTSDFNATALVRMLYQYADAPLLTPDLKADIEEALIHFKYWIDEPGIDPMVYWSENHHILFHSSEYLVGQLFPDTVFPNSGMTGAEHVAKARSLLLRWMELRSKMGFTEWHSSNYYEEDIGPLVNLCDFADDPSIRDRACMMADLLLFDIAMSSHAGVFGGSHGRTFEKNTATPEFEATRATAHLVFGQGSFNRSGGVSFSPLSVTPNYVPAAAVILAGLPEHQPPVWTDRARMSVDVEDAADFRLTTDPDDFPSILFWWSAASYALPEIVDGTFAVASAYQLFDAGDFFPLVKPLVPLWELGILDDLLRGGVEIHAFVEGIGLNETNTIAHHKPGAMLASAQDKLAGRPSFQNHSWSAALGGDIAVFTTHPLTEAGAESDYFSYFTGGASHPRIAQHEDVAIQIFNPVINWPIDLLPENANTHALFPFDRFDETATAGNWTFGRKGTGYIGIYSHGPNFVPATGRYAGSEIVAPGKRQLWICEIGDALEDGTFQDFIDRVSAQAVTFGGPPEYAATYASDMGLMSFDWTGPFTIDGVPIAISDYPRYDNPFTQAAWMDRRFEITAGGETAVLDFDLGDCDDGDGDGWGATANAECPELAADCDDTDAGINPGAVEVPGNGVDDDCDGSVDETPPLCGTLGGPADGGAAAVLFVVGVLWIAPVGRLRSRLAPTSREV